MNTCEYLIHLQICIKFRWWHPVCWALVSLTFITFTLVVFWCVNNCQCITTISNSTVTCKMFHWLLTPYTCTHLWLRFIFMIQRDQHNKSSVSDFLTKDSYSLSTNYTFVKDQASYNLFTINNCTTWQRLFPLTAIYLNYRTPQSSIHIHIHLFAFC
jgi:hypothetical protein